MKKRWKALAALTMAAILTVGCGAGGTAPEVTAGGADSAEAPAGEAASTAEEAAPVTGVSDETLTVALALEPGSLLPSMMGSKEAGIVLAAMTETLLKWDPVTGEISGNLASGYEWIDDTHFRMTLNEGIMFQDGSELTTADVLYTFQQRNALSAGGFTQFNLDNTEIEDDYNMVFELKQVWPQAPERFVQDNYRILSKKSYEAIGGSASAEIMPTPGNEGIGTGKYTFKEWIPGERITIERNDNYWNKEDMPYYKTIKFVFVNDAAARAMAVESGDVNVGTDLPTSQGAIYEESDTVDVHYIDTELTGVLFMNTQHNPALADERVREAVYKLVDVNALNQMAGGGRGKICDTTISPYSITYDGVQMDRAVDVEGAKELLKEAGYESGLTLEFTLMATQQQMGEIIKENLRQGGIEVNLTVNETPTHFSWLREGNYDLHYADLSPMYYTENIRLVDGRIPYSDVAGGAGLQDEAFYELADKCYAAIDMEERKAAYAEAQEYMREHYVAVGTMTTVKLELVSEGLTGAGLTGTGWEDITAIRPTK